MVTYVVPNLQHPPFKIIQKRRGLFALGGALACCGRRARLELRGSVPRQASAAWLCRRWLVLHAGKLLLAACVAAAMQLPSAVGAVLVAGAAALAPARRGAAGALDAASGPGGGGGGAVPIVLLQVLSAAWLLACYALQVPAVKDALIGSCGAAAAWALAWLGTPILGPDPASGQLPFPEGGAGVEALLRWKALLLAAAALWQRARRWAGGIAASTRAARARAAGSRRVKGQILHCRVWSRNSRRCPTSSRT
jgi:hypothetical protein